MGSFYSNVTVRTTDRDRVRTLLAGARRTAYISAPEGAALVVYDRATEEQEPAELDTLASLLSSGLACPALAVLVHDDDMLWYGLYQDGALVDEYNSKPEYFEGGDAPPAGGDVAKLLAAFPGAADKDRVGAVLKGDAEEYPFETDRHIALAEAAGLPTNAVGAGFTSLDDETIPPEEKPPDLVRVG